MSAAGMHNSEGVNVDLYIPRKWFAGTSCGVTQSDAHHPIHHPFLAHSSATNRLIQAKDKASIQLNIGHVNAAGVYTGEFTPLALCGFVRAMGEADGNLDRLWTKCYDESKLAGVEM
mmetsp:Transcript_12129/g.25596  ORF Transcript_12129/g.25596 Transcript_12129/m.25596 type:complete len:117 (+) Transcript_12129:52-402(+)